MPNYSTEKFLIVLRPFVSLGGYPAKMISDNGTQLTAANEEPKKVASFWDWDELTAFGATKGMEWKFLLADAPWQNGTSKALVKSVKKAITVAVGESVMTFCELQTVFFEEANLVNERPVGRHPTSPEDGLTCARTTSFLVDPPLGSLSDSQITATSSFSRL